MSDTIVAPGASRADRVATRVRLPFNARPVCAAGRESRSSEGPYSTHYTAVASYLYINRLSGSDRFGKVPDGYVDRGDLIAAGRCHPQQKTPPHLRTGDALWREADEAAAVEGPRAVSATLIVADLPVELGAERWTWLVEEWVYRNLIDKGMIIDWAVHHRPAHGGHPAGQPHVHLLATSRFWRAGGRHGSRHWQWFANADQTRAAEESWLALLRARGSLSV